MQEYQFKPYTVEDYNEGSRKVIYRITGKPWDVSDLHLPNDSDPTVTVDLIKNRTGHSTVMSVNIENLFLAPHLVIAGSPVYIGDQVWVSGVSAKSQPFIVFQGLHEHDTCLIQVGENDNLYQTHISSDLLRLVGRDLEDVTLEQHVERVRSEQQRSTFNLSALRLIKIIMSERN